MTREQKLALIVGFALVLVVGILISDHLSPASLDEPIETLAFGSPIGELPPVVVINDSREHVKPIDSRRFIGEKPDPDPKTDPPVVTIPEPEFLPIKITQGVDDIASSKTPKTTPTKRSNPDTHPKTEPEPVFTQHVVQRGENLSQIAARFLGSSGKWRELANLNSDRVGPDGSVREGTTLRIPRSAITKPAPKTMPSIAKPATTPSTYTVKRGDTLSEIAQTYLGTTKRADEILKLNNIDDADEIYAGRVLKMPAR